jgi:hypothetical protein
MSELASVPHRVLEADALVKRRCSGSPSLARRGWAASSRVPCQRALTAGRVVGKEFVRAVGAFLTNDVTAFGLVTGCDRRDGR